MNGTDATSDFSCCVVVPWLRVAEAGAAASDSGGHRIGAPKVHTCTGSCVWCLEAVVRASRGHKSVPVEVGGVHFRMEWCMSTGHEDMGLHMSGKGCVLALRVLQNEQS